MTGGTRIRRGLAGAMICAGALAGCRDLVFEDGHRLEDDHVLAGRSAAEGGDALTRAEHAQRFFVSTDGGLSKLQSDLRSRVDLEILLKSVLRAYAGGQLKIRDPRAASPTLTTTSATQSSPLGTPVDVGAILREDDANPGELEALCAHPLLGKYIDSGCNGLGDFSSVPMDDLEIDVDSPNITVGWDAPRQVASTLRPTDEPGSCTTTEAGVKFDCSPSFVCPRDAANVEIAGTCVWARPCTSAADCVEGACAAWGGCTDPAGLTAGQCNTTTGQCTRYLDLDEDRSDFSATAPVVRIRVPFDLDLDPNDTVGALIEVNLKKLVVDVRLQPQVCVGSGCRTFGRVAFDGYSPSDVVFSTAGVDVRARSNIVSRDYEIIPSGCLFPGAELLLSPFIPLPPGSAGASCFVIAAEVLPPLIDKALKNASEAVGPLVDTLLSPTAIQVPTGSLPSWFPLDAAHAFYRTTDGRTLPLGRADGAWTNDTIDILAKGASHSHVRVDLNDSPVADACAGGFGIVPPQCAALCGERPVPCDLSNAKICLHFNGETSGCEGGLLLRPRNLEYLMETIRESPGSAGLPTVEQVADMVKQITDATAPIPAVPQLATLLDASPLVAKTLQATFSKPLDAAFGGDARYTDIVHCPATGPRPAACPSGVNGPVFKFVVDGDHDGIADENDLCPNDADVANVNSDADAWCDGDDLCDWTPSLQNTLVYCDCDADGDHCRNQLEGTPIPGAPVPTYCTIPVDSQYDENPEVSDGGEDTDGDERTNDCDPDDDGDNVLDYADNCPSIGNPTQADQNGDGFGDACDPLCPGAGAPCPDPNEIDPSVLPMGMIDFDFGAYLISGCLADGAGCWGFFRAGCSSYGVGGGCVGGGEISRWIAPTGSFETVSSVSFDLGSMATMGDLTKDGVADLLLSAPALKQPTVSAIDGATGKSLWQVSSIAGLAGSSIAVGPTFVAIGAPTHISKTSGSADGAVQLLSLDGKPLGEPIVGPVPGGRFGSSLSYSGGMLLVGAPGPAQSTSASGGRIYAIVPGAKQSLLLLEGSEVKAAIGAIAPTATTYAGSDVLLVPTGGSVLVVERIGKQFGKLGKVITRVDTGTSSRVSVSEPADFDGDGIREIAIGIPGYLKSAGTLGFLSEDGKLRSSGLWAPSGARFGESVVALGDLDGDGASELGVTMPGVDVPKAPYPGSFIVLKSFANTKYLKKGP